MGDGGGRIHQWQYEVEAWRQRQSRSGGGVNRDHEIAEEKFARAGAYVMGRRMFDEGEVGWPDPPPFRAPVFVLTHHPREPWVRQGGTTFTFVTDGIDSAVAQAREAARGKDLHVAGGAATVQQALNAGLLDELQLHLAPVLLGRGSGCSMGSTLASSGWRSPGSWSLRRPPTFGTESLLAMEGQDGPWIMQLSEELRDALGDAQPSRLPAVAEQWVRTENFGGQADYERHPPGKGAATPHPCQAG